MPPPARWDSHHSVPRAGRGTKGGRASGPIVRGMVSRAGLLVGKERIWAWETPW